MTKTQRPCAPRFKELQSKMTETADAQDANRIRRTDAVMEQGREHRDPGTKERTCVRCRHTGRNGNRPVPMRFDVACETSVVAHDCGFAVFAQMGLTVEAGVTVQTAFLHPAH